MSESKANVIIVDRKFTIETATDVFYKYKAEIIEALRKNLIDKDKDTPGRLIQSIDVTIEERGNKLTFSLEMEDYWKFVDQGVDGTETKYGSEYHFKNDGKPVNLGAMLEFIKVRGIKAELSKTKSKQIKSLKNKTVRKTYKKMSGEKARKVMAFAMGINQKKHGIKPTRFFSSVINEDLKDRLTKDLTDALKRDIEIDIKASFNGNS